MSIETYEVCFCVSTSECAIVLNKILVQFTTKLEISNTLNVLKLKELHIRYDQVYVFNITWHVSFGRTLVCVHQRIKSHWAVGECFEIKRIAYTVQPRGNFMKNALQTASQTGRGCVCPAVDPLFAQLILSVQQWVITAIQTRSKFFLHMQFKRDFL